MGESKTKSTTKIKVEDTSPTEVTVVRKKSSSKKTDSSPKKSSGAASSATAKKVSASATPKKVAVTTAPTTKPKTAKKSETTPPQQPPEESLKLPTIRKVHFRPGRIIGLILVVLIAAFCARVAIWEHFYIERMEGAERPTAGLPIEGEEEETDREEPTSTEISEYTVAADKPRYLSIPSVGIVNSRIVEVGTKADGALDTPYNIYDTGWYTGSALPGTKGTTVMDGHGGAPGIGIFGNLPLVAIGADITVVMGDGRAYTYTVVDTATKALGDEANAYMTTAFTSPESGKPSITLITCTGDWWLASRTYSHRFFARAVLSD